MHFSPRGKKRWPFLNKLESLHPWKLCAKFGKNLHNDSEEEKCEKFKDRQTDRRRAIGD